MTTTTGTPSFKDAARFRPGFNQTAGAARLQKLLDKHGYLDPGLVVRDAMRQGSVLAPAFIWDADEALRDSHEHTARYLLRNFVTVTMADDDSREEVRAVVPVFREEDAETREYVGLEEAMDNADYQAQVFARARSELFAFQRKYSLLTRLARVFAAIDELRDDEA